jgi:hypothetical protein
VWWDTVARAMGGRRFEPTAIHEVGEGVCAELAARIVEGVEIPQTMWQAARISGDRIRSWTVVRSEAEAHAWLGSDEPSSPSDAELASRSPQALDHALCSRRGRGHPQLPVPSRAAVIGAES